MRGILSQRASAFKNAARGPGSPSRGRAEWNRTLNMVRSIVPRHSLTGGSAREGISCAQPQRALDAHELPPVSFLVPCRPGEHVANRERAEERMLEVDAGEILPARGLEERDRFAANLLDPRQCFAPRDAHG